MSSVSELAVTGSGKPHLNPSKGPVARHELPAPSLPICHTTTHDESRGGTEPSASAPRSSAETPEKNTDRRVCAALPAGTSWLALLRKPTVVIVENRDQKTQCAHSRERNPGSRDIKQPTQPNPACVPGREHHRSSRDAGACAIAAEQEGADADRRAPPVAHLPPPCRFQLDQPPAPSSLFPGQTKPTQHTAPVWLAPRPARARAPAGPACPLPSALPPPASRSHHLFLRHHHPSKRYPPRGVDFKIKFLTVGGKKLKLTIWDTAGQERFRTITSSYYRGAQGIILGVDYKIEANSANKDCVKVLVGNKVDKDDERMVTREEGLAFAQESGCLFLETSAKTRENVEKCFEELALKILEVPSLLEEGSSSVVKRNNLKQKQESHAKRGGRCCQ
ncbi:hypothetical protein PR202_gb08187 [Eleusine coracana subsp. coracana]|uniref:Uncharacterized protein n=1 Tax=Eleusine coracana subsp. coracana TaxID=191504 RepID=A0AAV5EEW8_ELECO|nr:hypothetical protein PR202_gb08187 [Eleusine coracana subsp. coracana]